MAITEERETIRIKPLGAVLGAEITGVDLSQPVDAATKQAIHDAFLKYKVLCFRDQKLSHERQVAFSEMFGTLRATCDLEPR